MTKAELIRPKKQGVWGWPGAVNFILGGMATGFYLLGSLMTILQSNTPGASQAVEFKLLAPVLACLGFLSLMTGSSHIKSIILDTSHPLRSRHLFRHLRHSWMSRETLASVTFILAAFLDWLFPHPILWSLAIAAAAVVVISHGFILYRVRAITAWNVPLIPFLFTISNLVAGSGLILLTTSGHSNLKAHSAVIGLICVVLDLVLWLSYLYLGRSHDIAFREATEPLCRFKSLVFIVGIGHVFPALLLLLLLVVPGLGANVWLWRVIAALAGLAMIIGGVSQKAGVIIKASYLRGIVMEWPTGDTHSASLAS
ncbi:MAG: hypothetical protein SXV54_10715 [Chloroflexota bacterium]|nr:hypothetical protein [Chloroflexota bacterium]